ncbi:hypothetical protein C5E45_03385 [Nocardia nova]|uniref:Uncharacterized protein n=1 Tax=Nocardia nova TaxID=37330 RepID=A0A2S6AXZ7_9NOCA|nr:hypothetical protein [Nocardia nova]PPJ34063.1 hypothetical protein C5E41_00110 [Nocardia nova]PPJ40125.1 hypothetical protein C5E45_03385 [Nocardia nova]
MGLELAVALRKLEEEGSTGVLRAGDGSFHLTRGAIVSADCRRTTGLDRLVVEAGVATAEDWQRAGSGDPGRVLAQPQLETLALLSVFDAAYFLLASATTPEFEPAPEHWLAPVCHINPGLLVNECARRGDPEAGPWPAEAVDRAPVVPVRRVRRRRISLTGGQAEVLAAADGRRTVADIARELGRTSYGCLVAVRDLTLADLIQPADATTFPAIPVPPARSEVVVPPPLVRRRRSATSVVPPDHWESPVDVDVLVRLRAALEELE